MHEPRCNRQLRGGECKSFPSCYFLDAVHFVQYFARLDLGDVVFGVALAIAHAHFRGFLRNRLVRENTDPHPAAPLNMSGQRPARRLNLTRRQPPATGSFQPIFTETHLTPLGRNTFVAPLLFLAVLPSSWLQHALLLLACAHAL